MNTQFQQQQQFTRGQPERSSSTNVPHSSHPKLPSLHGLGPPDQRYNNATNGGQATATSPSSGYPLRPGPIGTHQRGNESDDNNNNLFANGGRDFAANYQRMEEQVKQLSEQVRAMEAEKMNHRDQVARQQEQIDLLSKELFALRGNIGPQGQTERPPAAGAS